MSLWSLTFEKIEELRRNIEALDLQRSQLEALQSRDIWRQDIQELLAEWDRQTEQNGAVRAAAGRAAGEDPACGNAAGSKQRRPRQKKPQQPNRTASATP
jgi:DNA topoisomerase-2